MWQLKTTEDLNKERRKRILPSVGLAIIFAPFLALIQGVRWRGDVFLPLDEAIGNLPVASLIAALTAVVYYVWPMDHTPYFCPDCEKQFEDKSTCECGKKLEPFSKYKWIE